MTVKIIPLESGRFMLKWKSMEKEQPGCVNYEVRVGKEIVGLVPAGGKEEYTCIVGEVPRNAIVKITALGPRNRETKTADEGVYQGVGI